MNLGILYLARNRLAFTQATFELLLANTRWQRVTRVTIYDDNSEDGTKQWLEEAVVRANRQGKYPPIELLHSNFRSPPEIMNDYIRRTDSDYFVKLDNDIALPKGWLQAMLGVMECNPELELLGMEAGQTELAGRDGKPWDKVYRYEPCSHIGGVGLMQSERFRQLPPINAKGRFGWTEHQELYRWNRGWITPDLLVPQLDRIPIEPWYSLTLDYRDKGWSRNWPFYDETWAAPYYSWLPDMIPA